MVALNKRKCKNCGALFKKLKPLQYLCDKICEVEYQKKLNANRKPKQNKEQSIEIEKSLQELRAEARTVFQKWVRLRDEKQPCISCGTERALQWDGGHFFKAELYSGLIFTEENCHKQCSVCNYDGDGNQAGFKHGLILRYGLLYYNSLVEIKDRARSYKYNREEFKTIVEVYKQKINELNANRSSKQ